MEKAMRRFTLLLMVALLGGTERLAAQETVETRGITSEVKIEEVIFGHLTELNGKFKLRAASISSPGNWRQSGWSFCVSWCPRTRVAVLVNPANATTAESTLRDVTPAARAMGPANPSPQGRYKPRDRCSFRYLCARAA
jgi:hypothetical protein